MAAPPFKVKAIYAYTSEHDDDLSFPEGQIITVTEVEDADWYVGEYTSADGASKSGLFPNNFVEKYEPVAPARPTRAARPKPADPPAPVEPSSPVAAKAPVEDEEPVRRSLEKPAPVPEPVAAPKPTPAVASPPPAPKPEPVEPAPAPAPAPAPVKADPPPAAKKAPPPVAEKSSSFKDRLAAFNKQGAGGPAPMPFKPGGSSAQTFIKKPFVAPPPSRNAYVPPVQKQEPPTKVYRREEDPEIAAQRREDEELAERAGLAGEAEEGGEDEAPKPVSLKERIALLQRQQQEAAAKRAEAGTKKKPERPPKKRVESHEGDAAPRASMEQAEAPLEPRTTRDSSDVPREMPPPVRKSSRPPAVPKEREISDGNEADASGAGDSTADDERQDDSSTEEERETPQIPLPGQPHPSRHPKAPVEQPEVGDEEDTEEAEEEEDEVDEETRRQQALRERMAKLSGGMGMGAMMGFGGPPGGMAMPGMGGALKKKAAAPRKSEEQHYEDREEPQAARAPMVPIPGMGLPGMTRSMSNESEMTVGKEKEDDDMSKSISSLRSKGEVADVEEVASPRERHAPPPVPSERVVPQSPSSAERGVPPPVPGGRPSMDSRPPPPAPPTHQMSESEGSEADDEIMDTPTTELPLRGAPPPLPTSARPPQQRMSMDSPTLPLSPTSPTEGNKRASRLPPPIPVASPTMPPAAPGQANRAPPPPPPTQALPTRQGTTDSLHRKALSGVGMPNESGSEYEGDYDTDIASGEKHKDALKTPHQREESLDGSVMSVGSPPIPQSSTFSPPAGGVRAMAPLPPTGGSRKSSEQTRGAPPPVPVQSPPGGDDDYDPFNYSGPTPTATAARSPPAVPSSGAQRLPPLPPTAAPAMPAPPPVPSRQQDSDSEEEEEDEDDLYTQPAQPPPRKSIEQQPRKSMEHNRPPPPLPPGAAPPQNRAPPPLPPNAAPSHAHFDAPPPAPPHGKAAGRPSMDQEREHNFGPPSRKSTEPLSRPSMSGQRPPMDANDFIARDLDLGESSQWWTQPNTPPPSLQNRSDVGFEIEESSTSKRGGKTLVSKDVYVVYQDYSQTVITARFDTSEPADVQLEQRHEAPPGKLRQDQLENYWTRYGASISKSANALSGNAALGDGSAHALVAELVSKLQGALAPVGTRAYGALVYANLGNATVQQFDEIRAGDIVTFRNARFSGKHGGLHTKYSLEVVGHVAVVGEWDGTKKKLRVIEQGREKVGEKGEVKKSKKGGKIEGESYRLEDLRSGEVRVWRVVGREFVGWNS